MAHRQIETTSIHSSTYHTGWIRISLDSSSPWQVVAHSGHNSNNDAGNNNPETTTPAAASSQEGENVLPCTYLDLATQIHMHGTERLKKYPKQFRWIKDVNFHETLRLPTTTTDGGASERGMLVLFEGMCEK